MQRNFKSLFAGALLLALIGSGTSAYGAIVFSDSFTYADGALVGQGGWTQTGTTTTNPIQVVSGRAALTTTGQDAYSAFASTVTHTDGDSIFTGMTLNISAAQATGDYIVHLSDPPGTTSIFLNRLFARSSGAGYVLGIYGSGSSSAPVYGTTELSFNTDYQVVSAWNFVTGTLNDTFNLYVDPSDATEANNSVYATQTWTGANAEPAQIRAANLRQGSTSNAPTANVDNLMVATQFSDIVPEPGSLTLLAAAGLIALRRRR